MVLNRSLLAFLAFIAAVVFFAIAVFGETLGDINLIATGLLCVAIGLALQALPGPGRP